MNIKKEVFPVTYAHMKEMFGEWISEFPQLRSSSYYMYPEQLWWPYSFVFSQGQSC